MSISSTRTHIVEAADLLFYAQGYDHTSFADIAEAVQISRGNFYYHFKSKDQILQEVIHLRLEKTRALLRQWEKECATPEQCIERFIKIQITNRQKIRQHGCPVGTLCGELAKLDHALQRKALQLFELFREWLGKQFVLLGAGKDADRLAMHLLARSQGVATLANAFGDDEFVEQEVVQMCDWLAAWVKEIKKGAK